MNGIRRDSLHYSFALALYVRCKAKPRSSGLEFSLLTCRSRDAGSNAPTAPYRRVAPSQVVVLAMIFAENSTLLREFRCLALTKLVLVGLSSCVTYISKGILARSLPGSPVQVLILPITVIGAA